MILLDDAQSTIANPSSRLYEQALRLWTIYPQSSHAQTIAAVDQCLHDINKAVAQGEYVIAAFAYELGLYIHNIDRPAPRESKEHPLMQAWSFKSYERLSKADVDTYIAKKIATLEPESQVAGVANLVFSADQEKFTSDIQTIQEYIRNGDT